MLLPEAFWRDREGKGFLGGVEMGLMSTTADRDIAIQYSGLERRRAAIFEIQARRTEIYRAWAGAGLVNLDIARQS